MHLAARFVGSLVIISVLAGVTCGQQAEFYVTPFYSSQGPHIEVGEFSELLTKATAASIDELASKLRAKEVWPKLPAETMFVLAVRLYDLGHKDDSVYWFYSAQMRARLLNAVLQPDSLGEMGSEGFELMHAHASFQQLAGIYINGYAFGDLPKLQATLQQVLDEATEMPDLAAAYPTLQFIDPALWPDRAKEIAAGLKEMLDYIEDHSDEIRAQRKANGVEGKY